jgi:Right handed beta helix region
MSRLSPVVVALSVIAALAIAPAQAAQRAFVASSGNDANTPSGCGLAAPCRTFATAMTVVSDGGEIVALDAAGYGPVTVTKNVTITANPGFYAGIAVPASGTGVTIATAGINVILRGLNINSTGALNGVSMTNGSGLSIENCVISNFSVSGGSGIYVNAPAKVRIVDSLIRDNDYGVYIQGGARAAISGSKILGNATAGLYVYSQAASTSTEVNVTDSVLTHNAVAVWAFETTGSALNRIIVIRSTVAHNTYGLRSTFSGGPTIVSVSESLVASNITPFAQEGAGSTFESFGNNTTRYNGLDVGTITLIALR